MPQNEIVEGEDERIWGLPLLGLTDRVSGVSMGHLIWATLKHKSGN